MDSDDYSDANPSQPSRQMPLRAAKLKEPVRLTRSLNARIAQSSASDTQASSDEVLLFSDGSGNESTQGDDDGQGDDFVMTQSRRKRKISRFLTAASKRPRRTKYSEEIKQSPVTPRRRPQSRPKGSSQRAAAKSSHTIGEKAVPVLKGDWQTLPYMLW
jgi:hypothetical protein